MGLPSLIDFEDGWLPCRSQRLVHGGPVVTAQSKRLMEPEELFIWELLYQTIIDCYKIATGQWKHFCCMRWHEQSDAVSILATAREYVTGWIESDAFADYARVLGWNPDDAMAGARAVLNGERNTEVEALVKRINKERDARRDREENFHE